MNIEHLEGHAFPVPYPKGKFGMGMDVLGTQIRKLQNEISIMSRIKEQFLTAGDLSDPNNESLSNSYMFMIHLSLSQPLPQ